MMAMFLILPSARAFEVLLLVTLSSSCWEGQARFPSVKRVMLRRANVEAIDVARIKLWTGEV